MLHTRYFAADVLSLPLDPLSRLRHLLGWFLAPAQTYRWRRFLLSRVALADIARNAPHLASRIYRPYLAARLDCARRVDLLMSHYRLALDAGCGDLMRKASLQPLPVCEFTGRSGTRYQLCLSAADRHRPDGEFVLRLMIGNACIYTAAFSLAEEQGRAQLRLGGLHGIVTTDDALRIKTVTRDFFGWRPKDMMIDSVREIGSRLGCARLVLTGNANRLPSGEKRICKKSSDYDRTWKDMQATARGDGDYELPCAGALPAAPPCEARLLPPKERFRRGILEETGNRVAAERNAER